MRTPTGQNAPIETLSGRVERVVFHNAENGYCVFHLKARGHQSFIPVVGYLLSLHVGQMAHISGAWALDRNHGRQFQAQQITSMPPTTPAALEKYLSSGFLKGIGPVSAKKLVEAFGEQVLEIIEKNPERLHAVEGLGPQRVQKILKTWQEKKALNDIVQFLHHYGISPLKAMRIYKVFGPHAVGKLTKNPYQLTYHIKGIGFSSADEIAQKLGLTPDHPQRIQAGLLHVLKEAASQGQCGLPSAHVLQAAHKLLQVSYPLLTQGLETAAQERKVYQEENAGHAMCFLKKIYHDETAVGNLLWHLSQGALPWKGVTDHTVVHTTEKVLGLTLAPSQKEALLQALASKVMVITGGPGVGKTTLMKSFVHIIKAQGLTVHLCAPTGRAAQRLREQTNAPAKTIHRLLELNTENAASKRSATNPLACDVLIVDEVSMVDVSLMAALLRAVPPRSALLLVGDPDQLPSVGPGHLLKDIITAGVLPVAHLKEIFRQSATSQITLNAHRVNQGLMPHITPGPTDFYFIPARDSDDCLEKLCEVVCQRIPKKFGFDSIKDVQVLCPVNRGALGTQTLNNHLQKRLNPQPAQHLERFGHTFGLGDKVMQIVNNYTKEVYNGDIGYITRIDQRLEEIGVTFDGREIAYRFDELDEITLAYATTIHKAQGSEHLAIVIPILTTHFHMLQRTLLYTALTRGKRLVVLIGQKKAVALAVRNVQAQNRWSRLGQILQTVFGQGQALKTPFDTPFGKLLGSS